MNGDHEIIAGGKLYDIVKTETTGGKIRYYAISDQEEDAYVQHLSDWRNANSEDKSLPGKSVALHVGKYFEKVHSCLPAFGGTGRLGLKVTIRNDLFRYQSPLHLVFSPPPEPCIS